MSVNDGAERAAEGGSPRIYYLSKYFGYPLGGVRIAHHHVALLRKNGFDARILLMEEPKQNFFDGSGVLVEHWSQMKNLSKNDVLVVPEPWYPNIKNAAQLASRTFVFCQNHYNIFFGLRGAPDYRSMGVDELFSCSGVISKFLEDLMGIDHVPVIRNAIDHDLFKPGHQPNGARQAKRRQIAFMPRKMRLEASFIQGVFRRKYPRHADVEWVAIEDVQESDVARMMRDAAIFLSLGRNEGFGLPPIEAMASGCLIVGFVADGGREFATERNGLWCEPENYVAVADRLADALDGLDTPVYQNMVEAGLETAASYSLAGMEEDLIAFWSSRVDTKVN